MPNVRVVWRCDAAWGWRLGGGVAAVWRRCEGSVNEAFSQRESAVRHGEGSTWLNWYPTLLSHFATGRQISYAGGLISYTFFTGTKPEACVTAADLIVRMKTCFASLGLWAVAILVHCRNLVAVQYINTQPLAFFVDWLTDNLHLLDCSVTWSLLTRTDTDWTC